MAAMFPMLTCVTKCSRISSKSIRILDQTAKRCSLSLSSIIRPKTINNRYKQVAYYYVKAKEKEKSSTGLIWAGAGFFSSIFIGATIYLGQPPEQAEDRYKDDNIVLGYLYRVRDRLTEYKDTFSEPSSEVLLPDPLPEPYIQPKYTLVLELTDVLVHPEYDRKTGWRFRKRPGVQQFLKALTMPLFEIVIYTHENGFSSAPVVDGLDPEGCIMYKLFRDATKYTNGTHVKDLSRLNRDIRKIIFVDCDKESSAMQPRNSLVLPKWDGDAKDIGLLELIPFFHAIAMSNVDDVRPILDFYRNEDDPIAAFRRNQDALRKQQEEMLAQQTQQASSRTGLFSKGLFGMR